MIMSTPDDSHFDPDDPRLTAYALGELPDPADRAHVEALLAASPEARAELADIRSLTATLTAEYEQDRLATPPPANVVRLPEPRRAWVRPMLAMAAMLLLGGLAFFMLPVFHSVQVKGQRERSAVFSASEGLQPHTSGKSESSSSKGQLAEQSSTKNGGRELALAATTPPPAAVPSAPLLAQTQLPTLELKDGRRVDDFAGTAAPAPAPPVTKQFAFNGAPTVTLDQNRADASGGRDRLLAPGSARDKSERGDILDKRYSGVTASSAPETFAGDVSQPPGPAKAKLAPPSDALRPTFPTSSLVATRRAIQSEPESYDDTSRTTETSKPSFVSTIDGKAARLGDALNTAAYDHVTETPFLTAKENPLSTFSVDVDTASYSIVRRFIEQGSLPPAGAVRIEEMLNYFPYDYAPPESGDERPFAIHLEGAACPWNPDHRLVRVALKGREIEQDKRPPSNLVFLLDVSGSMEPRERLPLIKESLRLLVERLTDNDRVAIVVYAGNSGLVLPSTNGTHKDTILRALDHLEAGGSTNGASGIKLAYKVAQENFLKGGTNRVILATDGDFNVGTTSQGELVRLIEKEAKGGVFLSVLGVGTDNLRDSTMQKLADHGNGNYAYLDRIEEGKKVLVEQMSGTLVTIAKDVKIQVEFNPAAVNSYRLIGYEKRLLRKEDFNDDRVDAGEIGAGHSVTALYEVVPLGQTEAGSAPGVDTLKYQATPAASAPVRATVSPVSDRELLTVKIRHKAPDSTTSERSYEAAFVDHGTVADYANASPDFKFAAAVATFGLVLRDSPYKGNATLGAAIELAQESKGTDATGYRAGFIEMARRAREISARR